MALVAAKRTKRSRLPPSTAQKMCNDPSLPSTSMLARLGHPGAVAAAEAAPLRLRHHTS